MKALIVVLALVAVPASACDWAVTKKTDKMTDKVTCNVTSASGKITFYRYGTDRPNVVTASIHDRDALMLRVDDNQPIRMGENAYDRQKALDELLPQLETGKKLLVKYRDYPVKWQEGEAEICTLPKLLEACAE